MKETETEQKTSPQTTADISFEVGYKTDKTRFDLRMISVSEETEIQQKFNDLADTDDSKAEKEYRICLDALQRFSMSNVNLKLRFNEMSSKNERIIRAAFQQFRFALQPSVDFF